MQSSNSMNDRMNKLSIAAVIFLPLTFGTCASGSSNTHTHTRGTHKVPAANPLC